MKAKTVSQAKNMMRRALSDLIDPPPPEADQRQLRAHFGDQCAYCGADACRRVGQIDHADPDNGNGLGNLLLACPSCNGDEKREMGWRQFLRIKCGNDERTMKARQTTIENWLNAHRVAPRHMPPEVEDARQEAERAIDAFAKPTAVCGPR